MRKCLVCNHTLWGNSKFCGFCGADQNVCGYTLQEIYEQWSKIHYSKIGVQGKEGYQLAWRKCEKIKDELAIKVDLTAWQQIVCQMPSKSAQQKIIALCSQLCQYGVLRGIYRVNFAPYLVITGYDNRPTRICTDAEVYRLFEYASDKTNELWYTARIICVLIATGMRPNELFALKREDVNTEYHFFVGGSKTAAGCNRVIPIVDTVWYWVLERYLATGEDEFIFTSAMGKHIELHNWRQRNFYPLMKFLGINTPEDIRLVTPYSCRHTYASVAYRAGVRPELLSKMIGHTSFAFTAKTYIHNAAQELIAEQRKIENVLIGGRKDDSGYSQR